MSDLWKSPIVVPSVVYKDVPVAAKWLESAYGFMEREGSRLVGDGWTLTWMEVGSDGLIHLTTGGHGLATPAESGFSSQSLKVYVPDLDNHFETAKAAGAEIIMPPQDMFWGGRIYRAKDPEALFGSFLRQTKSCQWINGSCRAVQLVASLKGGYGHQAAGWER